MYLIAGVDYEPVNVNLTFTSRLSTRTQFVDITTIDDDMFEGRTERICLRIIKLTEPCPNSVIIGNDTVVLIAEDDRKLAT